MVVLPVYCSPATGSHHYAQLSRKETHASIYLKGVSQRHTALLQCWTNLAAEEGAKDDWYAIDIGHFSGDEGETVLVKEVRVPLALLERESQLGHSLTYGFAWRVASTDKTGQHEIEWLTSPENHAVVTFSFAQEDHLQRLLDDLHVMKGAEVVKEGEVAVLTFHLEVPSAEATKKSFQIVRPSRPITAGAVWERTKPTWHTSRSIPHLEDISEDFLASMIVLQYSDVDLIAVILPLCTSTASVSLVRRGEALCAEVDQFQAPEELEDRLKVAVGPTCKLHSLIRRCFQQSRSMTAADVLPLHSPLLGDKGLGLCSWEALGAGRERPRLSSLFGVLEGVEKRAPGSIAALLIDDGWQHISIDESGKRHLKGFDLDPVLGENDEVSGSQTPSRLAYYLQALRSRIPYLQSRDIEPFVGKSNIVDGGKANSRLATYIDALRKRFPHIKSYAVWMTLAGYWDGLDHDAFSAKYGPLMQASLTEAFRDTDSGRRWWLPAVEHLEAFYDDYFSFLREAGISFVKVDDQSDWDWINKLSLSTYESTTTPSAYYDYAWKAMTNAAQRHFGALSVVNCMALGHRFLSYQPTQKNGLHMARNSDDTFPNVPQSHIWHIYHNALNACLTSGSGNLLLDPDMITSFMSSEESDVVDWADYHAAFRACFSSSTIWLSDSVDVSSKGNDGILERLLGPIKDVTAPTSLGRLKTIQVSLQQSALPLTESVFASLTDDTPGLALKLSVGWPSGSKEMFGTVITAWNTRYRSVTIDCITEADVAQAIKRDAHDYAGRYLFLFSSSSSQTAVLLPPKSHEDIERESRRSAITSKPLVSFKLLQGSYQIFSIVSALPLVGRSKIACIGLLDKYNGLMAVVDAAVGQVGGIRALLSRAGRCGFVVHGTSLAEVEVWTASIDSIAVDKDHISTEQVQGCTLIIIDMIKHLRSICAFDKTVDEHWRVDVLESR